jgi:hypothetical protein
VSTQETKRADAAEEAGKEWQGKYDGLADYWAWDTARLQAQNDLHLAAAVNAQVTDTRCNGRTGSVTGPTG